MGNKAAWLESKQAKPLVVREASVWKPEAEEVLIQNQAIAINPVDWKMQDYGIFITKFPNIMGEDCAGFVEEVGEGVTDLKKGDRAIGHPVGLMTTRPSDNSFQTHTIVPRLTTSKLPDSVPFTSGTVLPLSISTAASALYQPNTLALPLPTVPPNPAGKGRSLLVWGGSSSVGITGIQLAIASGLVVVATASPHNHDLVKSLGVTHVFDHSAEGVVDQITTVLKGTEFAGVFDAISLGPTLTSSAQVTANLGGGTVATTLNAPEGFKAPGGVTVTPMIIAAMIVTDQYKFIAEGVWKQWVPKALETGALKAGVPEPVIVETKGLEGCQVGMDKAREGVSAKKLVVEL